MITAEHASALGRATLRQCAHCRLTLPRHPHQEVSGGVVLSFCCIGCVLVYRVIGSAGEGGRSDWFLAKLGLAALLSGNVMMFQSLTYFGTLDSLGPEVLRTSSWIMLVCSLLIFALLGIPMLRIASRGLLHGRLTLETLTGFGALAAIAFSGWQTLRGGHRHLYYDSGTMVLVLVTLGQYLDAESRRRALALLSPVMGRVRRSARVLRNALEIAVAPDAVDPGELVLVRAGEEIPVDGTVLAGSADVQEPLLTGEWRPRAVAPGDTVSAGSTALDGALTVSASGAAETLADRVERFSIEARNRRAPIEATVDGVTAVFIPAVMVIAALSLGGWCLAGDWERGFQAALSVLVVACPCALGIATPMATTIALSQAIGRGCLIRSGAVLETLSRLRMVIFDKTGTLTAGRPNAVEFVVSAAEGRDPDEPLRLAAALEQEVTHPFARALVESVRSQGRSLPSPSDVRVTPGAGAQGVVDGHHVVVGKLPWLASLGVRGLPDTSADSSRSGLAIGIDGRYAGEVLVDDPPRPEARAALAELDRMGITCHLVSGDRHDVVASVAHAVGVLRFASNQSPTDKPVTIRALRRGNGLAAMVGDGVNDAPALGAADAGIAFGPAADLARETADVTILREDLLEIPRLLALARKTFRIVRQNLAWAFAYNSVAVLIAALGLLRPVYAAAAMVLSSVCVVANSMRIGKGDGRR